jgi:hypothetical protein
MKVATLSLEIVPAKGRRNYSKQRVQAPSKGLLGLGTSKWLRWCP